MGAVNSHKTIFRPETSLYKDKIVFTDSPLMTAPSENNQPTDLCSALFTSILSKTVKPKKGLLFATSSVQDLIFDGSGINLRL